MSSCRILVMDPSPTVRRVVQLVLGRQGHDVLATGVAAEGADWLVREDLDLLIADSALMSPGSNLAQTAHRQGLGHRILLLVARESDLASANVPHLFKPVTPDRLSQVVTSLLREAASEDESESGVAAIPMASAGLDLKAFDVRGNPVLWSRLSAIPLPELLQLMRARGGATQVTVRATDRRVCITMRVGKIDFVQAEGLSRSYRLGSYLIRTGAIAEETLEDFFAEGRAAGQPLGKALVAAQLISSDQLRTAVALQNSELVYEVLRWADAEAVVSVGGQLSELEAETGLGLTIEEVLMEGLRRVDEWQRLERDLPSMDAILEPNLVVINGFDLSKLSASERDVLTRFRGGATLREVLGESEEQSFDLCRAVHLLMGARILRERPEAAP
ncbi:MAG: hypothetical protein CMH55_04300 [Myxococcales bacterium]|nr:hypothetical protein [Myxococcales bacterium]